MVTGLWKKYAVALLLIFALSTTVFLTSQMGLSVADQWSEAINKSGRQRMLSQQMLLFGGQLLDGDRSAEQRLRAATEEFARNHEDLVIREGSLGAEGRLGQDLQDHYFSGPDSLDQQVSRYLALSRALAGEPAQDRADLLSAMTAMSSQSLLADLDLAVQGYQSMAEADIRLVSRIELGAYLLAVIVLLLEARFIFWPAHRTIVDAFERVRQQTEELVVINTDLMSERQAVEVAARENAALAEDLHFAREEAEKYALFLNASLDSISQGVAVFDTGGRLQKWNGKLCEVLRIPDGTVGPGLSVGVIMTRFCVGQMRRHNKQHDPSLESLSPEVTHLPRGLAHLEMELVDGRTLEIDRRLMPEGFVMTFTDISNRRANEKVVERLAKSDILTGLANRAYFAQRLAEALRLDAKTEKRVGLALIDLDRFKPINDRYGHLAGDAMLRSVAERLADSFPEPSLTARLGGDEFAILLKGDDLSDPEGLSTRLADLVREIQEPVAVGEHQLNVGASIGVAFGTLDEHDEEALMRLADEALYSAKRAGRGRVHMSPRAVL